jgi:2-polyprenyl-6-methoxyphenol hydroxylase-like FAD-dependent oxidoreductase
VGDAGLHRDPITGQGIVDAFRDAELLADAIETDAFAEYEQHRNAAVMPVYELTCRLAALSPTPEIQALLASLRGNQPQIDRFIGALVGTVPIPEFFAGVAA